MPLYKTIVVNSKTSVKIWKITESFDDLMGALNSDLKPENLNRLEGMKSELHRRGFISIRYLLAEFGYEDEDLYYDINGKPYLKDGKYISITHSFIFSAVIVSHFKVGIDVEKQREKIVVIAKKFIDYEYEYLCEKDEDYIRKLTVIWGVKESLYKLFSIPGMLFKAHFLVIPFSIEDQKTIAWIDYNEEKYRHTAHFLEFEGFTCAYVLA